MESFRTSVEILITGKKTQDTYKETLAAHKTFKHA